MARVLVLNGPNLGRLGSREPEVYGTLDLSALRVMLTEGAGDGVEIDLRQTDDEGELIRWLHEAVDEGTPVILNPAAFTHYSYALRDAAALVTKAGRRSSRCTSPIRTRARSSGTPASSPASPPG